MVSASFRFYDGLGDFLPRERRGRTFSTPCARDATAKHMIEALGVPHTEVELLLVNGESAGFDHLLREGDGVAVYPGFARLDVRELQRLRSWPDERPRFVADAHLGGLARLLRMAGYDTLYDNHYHDDEIERLAREQGRVMLTRDRELLKRRSVEFGCYLHALDPAQQLRELFARLRLGGDMRPFTLCLHCNLLLRQVDKAEVRDRLLPRVAELHDDFTTCDHCARVYWKGSHHARMCALLADVELPPSPDSHP
ncbi:Mut7-C ubiquitin/RNAse domain-containing protein [Massilia sp. IC2-476]|uniref:Mut7-C ubiquitin/RNAse domain-containing protein n=1 Tax=Massilia sp. IC2-476 TaxID=2887199 RepID=UPI001D1045D9|nr:Mut7-C ubiquitin/RNAse domain-containing protein [Massilia sp. IC2-476]MCC2974574.1 Mut7-C ubiquitin/RNAse domain-containing protein [Massilia sp. IC2-476]